MLLKPLLIFVFLTCLAVNLTGQNYLSPRISDNLACTRWVDSVYNSLTITERIGQLLMIRANSTTDSTEIRKVADWITNYNLGGICFFKGGPVRQAIMTNYYQSLAKTPILISMDAEWGLGMRLDSTMAFARQMTLGAMQEEYLIQLYGQEIARQLRRMGVRMSFSPVADINNNPDNPVINVRSFGEDKEDVARKALHYMKGLQKGGVLSVAKHFPGHGDTDTDSHFALPFIDHSRATLDTLELYPFRKLIRAGIDGIMVAHLYVPVLDSTPNTPTSLSSAVVTGLLRKEMDFNGLIITDALDMKGAAVAIPGKIELDALKAGNDILLLPASVDSAISCIRTAVDSGWISPSLIGEHCKRVLTAKYLTGLYAHQPVQIDDLIEDLSKPESEWLNSEFYARAITMLSNTDRLIPLERLDTLKIASVTFGYKNNTQFQDRLSSYARMDHYTISREQGVDQLKSLFERLREYNLLIVSVNNTHPSPMKKFGMSESMISMIDSLLVYKPAILNLFALPYALELFSNADHANSVIISYQDNPFAYDMAAQLIFGGIKAEGELPVSIGEEYSIHSGIKGKKATRLKFSKPEDVGIQSELLAGIDSLVMAGIRARAFPGCQVLVAKDGSVIYSKSFGHHDYSGKQQVLNSDIYDLASITKVAATTLAIMRLKEERKLDIHKPLSKYLAILAKTNKNRMTIREVMTHQAGLIPWIPFYKQVLKNGQPDSLVFSGIRSEEYSGKVAEGLFIREDYKGIMMDSVIHSPLLPNKEMKYSDLGFILLQKTVEEVSGESLDQFAERELYRPMGLPTMGFMPLERFPADRIIPTENDTVFRHQLVHGYVHDPAAAMMGGVAGHAGLFSNATDLAALFQMLLQHGVYGGHRYFDSVTVAEFTSRQYPNNRRGLGFDKPQPAGEEGPACKDASPRSFGHTGFTGTYVWADPDKQLILVFLSNRVHPDAEENRLVKLGTRTKIQQLLYDAIRQSEYSPMRQSLNTTY
jgi:beta-glucosidase-like glycosyl hydrolase/CubicO group peptidase (beta-lactamase class C family)